jgi:hypothetical protein
MSEFFGMARLNFFVSFLVCISFSNTGFCSENVDTKPLEKNSKFIGSTSSKLFEDDKEDDYIEVDLNNSCIVQNAIRFFLILQDIECPEGEKLQKYDDELEIDIIEGYFLIGSGCDIEYDLVDDAQ